MSLAGAVAEAVGDVLVIAKAVTLATAAATVAAVATVH